MPAEGSGAIAYLKEYLVALYWEFFLAFRVLRAEGFDAIHACNPPDLIVLVGAFFKYLFGKRFLFDHHDINPEFYEAKFGRRDFFWRLLSFFERLTFRVADVSIATNESYRQIAIERGRMSPEKVFVVRSGPNLSRLKRVPPNPDWKKGATRLVAYVGVIGEPEGIDLLLEAIRHIVVVLRRRDVHFVIVGGGPQLDAVRRLSTDLGVEQAVTFTGRIPDSELMEILSTADVGVNPDRWSPYNDKSTMNKVMEYMAMGLPLVQFDSTEGRFSAGDASLYAKRNDPVSLAELILDLIDDPALREKMGAYGRDRVVAELSWEHEEPKLLAAYDALFRTEPRAVR